ncbi:MAG: hypothetical protein IRZ28_19415 [Steroidobacteraceae bacterium]|nr:hypothetical protein [Steroidobacteraceae bacterium]
MGPEEVEFELEFGVLEEQARERTYHVHVRCFAAWEFERHRFQAQRDAGSSNETSHLPPASSGVEELHLLDGELWIDDRKLYPGDYNRAEPGTADRRVWSETGCTCVLITSGSDVIG